MKSTILSMSGFGLLAICGLTSASAQSLAPDPKATVSTAQTVAPSKGWLDQDYMLGDWGGTRSHLEDEGVKFDFNDIGDFLSNVTGSQANRATYFGRFRAGVDLDLNKLVGVDAEFYATAIYQYGRNLSGDYLHTNTLTSSIAGTESLRVDQFWYKQWLFDHKFAFTIGQIATVNYFGATDFFDILFNDELGYAPNALFSTRQPFSPAGKPGVMFWQDLGAITPGLYTQAGVFVGSDNFYQPDSNGIYYEDDFNHGITEAVEVGYKEQNTVYDGVYKLGANGAEEHFTNLATGQPLRNDYNIYAIAEKTVFRPMGPDGKVDSKKGLDMLFEFIGEPGDRNPLSYEFTMGGRYTGLIPCRPTDKVGFGLIYSDNSDAASIASEQSGGTSLVGETTLEADYQYNPAPWLSIQPDVQYIIDPAGVQTRDNIVVLGLRTIVRF